MKKLYFIFFIVFINSLQSFSQTLMLKSKIESIVSNKKAKVGVAILGFEDRDTLSLNKDAHYPMQSMFKFHLALAMLHQVDKGKFKLDQKIWIAKKDLVVDTWSPIRDKYPNGDVYLTLSDVLHYTVADSDNTGCDLLFRLLGGPKKVNRYIHTLGIKEVSIVANEAQMHKDEKVQYNNWTTALAMVQLLEKFYGGKILNQATTDFLRKTMEETSTGPNRIKGLLPAGTIVAHKTGSSGANKAGFTSATNDAGIVLLPNGKHFGIVVLVSDSYENNETNEKIIAEISKVTWEYFSK